MPPSSPCLRAIIPLCAALALGCSDSTSPGGTTPLPASLTLSTVATVVGHPVYGTAPANDSRLFLVIQEGRIEILQNGALLPTPFLDISSLVSVADEEEGLLSVAFDPNYASNRYFYVYFTDLNSNIQIDRFTTLVSNPNV
ncbi:MAG TPA: PQQ-dependent sugar dehydrogenase, partial [Gemmatimonadaceae bacterium]|nr:PQQ-dependent sugar dehydrogenase [Gemmatimonadaceae bacterium]